MRLPIILMACSFSPWLVAVAHAEWQVADGPLLTKWSSEVSPQNALPEYPRPQLVRQTWQNLNGLWDYAITSRDTGKPAEFAGEILVPFPIESALSGVMKKVGESNRLWYRRRFKTPKFKMGQRILLHFGAVDWHATVYVNGSRLGEHKGGYTPFTFDITDSLTDGSTQELVVSVWDPADKGFQPRGKQVETPRGIWYTSVTGIWQTVWLETVSKTHVQSLHIVPDIDAGVVRVTADVEGDSEAVKVTLKGTFGNDTFMAEGEPGQPIDLAIRDAKLWSPNEPNLYDLTVKLVDTSSNVVDEVESYFGMRKIALAKDSKGVNRLFLNNKPLFHFGPLDQGWWPDGLYTAPTDAALRYDIEITRKLGFNMARKHVKFEPARWYYHCDKLGLMVWQDMPSGDKYIGRADPDLERTPESDVNFRREYREMIDASRNHPCIVAWVPFNEGWGQYATDDILSWTKSYDPMRLVDGPSGWTDRGSGDMFDIHRYPGPAMPPLETKRAAVLGEFGGLGLPLDGHLWQSDRKNWGYRGFEKTNAMRKEYENLMTRLWPLYGSGLAAAVYTQTTDVESEVNGLMTYDRAIIKHDIDAVAKIHRRFYGPPPIIKVRSVVSTSQQKGQTWRYTITEPHENWAQRDFDVSDWQEGLGGFGTKHTPGSIVRTEWNANDIWLRREFPIKNLDFKNLHLRIHHDEDAEVFINGQLVDSVKGYRSDYGDRSIQIHRRGKSILRIGNNTLAIHCRQTSGGQYIDAGLVDVVENSE